MRQKTAAWAEDRNIANKLVNLLQKLEVDLNPEDQGMIGQSVTLYTRAAYVRQVFDELLGTPPTAKNRPAIHKKIGTLWAEVDNLASVTRDLVGPLDRLHSALLRQRGGKAKGSPS